MLQKQHTKEERDSKIYASLGTILFSGLVLVILFSVVLKVPALGLGDSGIELSLGNSDDGMGGIQPSELGLTGGESSSPPPKVAKTQEDVMTQDIEDAPVVADHSKKTKPSTNPVTPPTEPTAKPPQQQIQLPTVNPNALYKGKSKSSSQDQGGEGGNEGITGKPGDQGKPYGTTTGKAYEGVPGQGGNGTGSGGSGGTGSGGGTGISYSLGGRGAKSLPKPSYNSNEQGVVVVTIWVNPEGKVTRVESGAKGTTISDISLRRMAETAAKQATFSPNPNAPEEQKGTITYRFLKQN